MSSMHLNGQAKVINGVKWFVRGDVKIGILTEQQGSEMPFGTDVFVVCNCDWNQDGDAVLQILAWKSKDKTQVINWDQKPSQELKKDDDHAVVCSICKTSQWALSTKKYYEYEGRIYCSECIKNDEYLKNKVMREILYEVRKD
jgi:hypothetical protein